MRPNLTNMLPKTHSMEDLLEKRTFLRFRVNRKFKAMALMANANHVICRIENISMGGIAVIYENYSENLFQPEEISILCQEDFWGVSSLPVKVVWQQESKKNNRSGSIRRLGLSFREISYQKKSQLRYFVRHFTTQEQ